MSDGITRHCRELNRCNQRGGRMLSLLDLLDANTLHLDLAAYLMARMMRGVSFMVGARPGGAGKTTVMGALLNLVPPDLELVAATAQEVRAAAFQSDLQRRCYVCHEIGAGPYFAYLWGRELRDYCALTALGHLLATNLHADDLEEARAQVCGENGVPEAHFNRFDLMLFLRMHGRAWDARRTIHKVYVSDAGEAHRLLFDGEDFVETYDAQTVAPYRAFLEKLHGGPIRGIEEVRAEVLNVFPDQRDARHALDA